MNKVFYTFVFLFLFIFLFTPLSTFAQPVDEILGVPIANTCGGLDCDLCDLLELAHNVLNFLVAFTVVAATIMFTWAGILYVTAGPNPGQIEKAHKIFWNVLIGLVITLIAWLIIDTIMKTLVDNRLGAPWERVLCLEDPFESGPAPNPGGVPDPTDDSVPGTPIPPVPREFDSSIRYCFGWADNSDPDNRTFNNECFATENECLLARQERSGQPNVGVDNCIDGFTNDTILGAPLEEIVTLSHDDAVDQLQDAGVVVTSTSGPGGVEAGCSGPGCTSLENINQATVNEVIALREECSCEVTVTGGTEEGAGHVESDIGHTSGFKIDVEDSGIATAFIEQNYEPIGNNFYLSPRGAQYTREPTHWDILVTGTE